MARVRILTLALALLAPLSALAQSGSLPECIRVEGTARWAAAGYNHIVRIENRCAQRARCRVSTDVNPQVQTVEVARGATVEVVTYLDNPASGFTPIVVCELLR